MKKAKKKEVITWTPKLVKVKDVKPTKKNYKIKTELGRERLTQSLELFGLASAVVCNTDLMLIDGNSRLEQAKERGDKEIWVSLPSRKLTPSEFREMSAMYDVAVAGDIDMESIKGDLGKTADFYEKWNMEVPQFLLDNLGAKAKVDTAGKKKKVVADALPQAEETKLVNLFFSEAQEDTFRKWEAKYSSKLKAEGTTDFVFNGLKLLFKTFK